MGHRGCCLIGRRAEMSSQGLARDFAKRRMTYCWGTERSSRSHAINRRALLSIQSSCTGPHVTFRAPLLSGPWTSRDTATHPFHAHPHRAYSASGPAPAVDDTRSG